MTTGSQFWLCARHDWLFSLVVTEFCCLFRRHAYRLSAASHPSVIGHLVQDNRPFLSAPPPHCITTKNSFLSLPSPPFPSSSTATHLRCPPTRSPLPHSLPPRHIARNLERSLHVRSRTPLRRCPADLFCPTLDTRSYPFSTLERQRSATCRFLLSGDWLPPRG